MNVIKNIIREILLFLHIDLTKNLKYDRLTRKIMADNLTKNDNCIDVGCHKGEILDLMLKYSPNGNHYGFEPIPYLFENLKVKYKGNANIFPYALSEVNGNTTFNYVKNAPAYSGIKKRRYDISNPDIEEINVEMKTLDSIISKEQKIDLVKIDVEGAEFGVIKGAKEMLKRDKPLIIFECGKGASDFYGTTPDDIFNYMSKEIGLNIYTLNAFINKEKVMSISEFESYFNSNEEYYFIAADK